MNCAQEPGHRLSPTEDTVTIVDERPVRQGEADVSPPPPAIRPELQYALRREIEQAIQPVLADFRKQSLRAVRHQVELAQPAELARNRPQASSEPESRREEKRPLARPGDHEPGSANGAAEQISREHGPAPARPLTSDIAGPVAEFLEQTGTRWLQSRLEDGRDALCSEPVRADVRERVEHVIRPVVDAGLELVPGEATRRELQRESEQTLDALLKAALDRLCSERVLTDFGRHAERAVHALVRGDVGTTLREVWEAVRALLQALVVAVQDLGERIFQLLIDLVLRAAQEAIGAMLKGGLATIAAVPVEEVEEKVETAKETATDRAEELRERLAERFETLQERVKEEVEQVKQRVADGLKSAVEDGTERESFGRPPTGRPPSLRPPSGRPPTGRPPSGRPPSGRPPSMTRRAK
jgi:hypothetical protein